MEVNRNTLYREYPGITGRKFRFDFAIPSRHLAIEIHGGAYVKRAGGSIGGAHHSIEGRRRDMEKARLANVEGWCYLEFEWKDVEDGTTFDTIQGLLDGVV
jgi:very-short-patch-repair endonuclease